MQFSFGMIFVIVVHSSEVKEQYFWNQVLAVAYTEGDFDTVVLSCVKLTPGSQ